MASANDWKTRAEDAERKLAEIQFRQFQEEIRRALTDTEATARKRVGWIMRAYADLLDSDVPMTAIVAELDKVAIYTAKAASITPEETSEHG